MATKLFTSREAEEKTVFIDLTQKAAKAKVVREGYQVPAAAFDKNKADFAFDQFEVLPPRSLPRVVSQSVPAGTKVTRGTVVDLVLVPGQSVPFDIFDGVHADFKGKTVHFMTENMLADAKTRQIFLKYEDPDDLPTADKALLQSQFTQSGISLDESVEDKSFNAAYRTARGALAFR
ncbi:MAG: hypothetical protein MUC46_00280 [Desulfobacterales bacterium]|jgi:hypothetical protein|nr:hypothetical protein [Desulfobacterales bacterium]